jgi:hypothetical protein
MGFQFGQKSWNRGTGCGNSARPGLWGGRQVTAASTRRTERLILAPFEVGSFYWLGILRIVLWFTRRPHNAGVSLLKLC